MLVIYRFQEGLWLISAMTNQSSMHKETKSILNLGNVCCHCVEKV